MIDMKGGYLADLRDTAVFATVICPLDNELTK